jgi:hypothetical protein
MKNNNPYNLCTWDLDSPCSSCDIKKNLTCKWSVKNLMGSMLLGWPSFIFSIFILYFISNIIGQRWPLYAYYIFVLAFFIYEIKFTCSHCPYYAKRGKFIKCKGGNFKLPKFFKYNPSPTKAYEKVLMRVQNYTLFIFLPIIISIAGIIIAYSQDSGLFITSMYALGIANIWSGVVYVYVLRRFFCSTCINFSCTFNSVDKAVVDKYLEKNEVMRNAWEKSGYKLG